MAGWSIQIAIYEKELASQLEGGETTGETGEVRCIHGGLKGRRGEKGTNKGTKGDNLPNLTVI